MPTLKDIAAKNILAARTDKKMSQALLADKAGLSVSYISMLERGERTPPLETLEHLAKALKMDPIDLLRAKGRR